MKYLKTYETIFGQFNGELKKYILLKHYARASKFETLELYSVDENNYTCTLLKHYNFDSKVLSEFLDNTKKSKIINVFKWEDEILLQSDNLDEILEHFDMVIDMVIDANKYNL